MTDKSKRNLGGGVLMMAAAGAGIGSDRLMEWAFGAGRVDARVSKNEALLSEHRSALAAHEAMIMNTREKLDDKIDRVVDKLAEVSRIVARIEGKLEPK